MTKITQFSCSTESISVTKMIFFYLLLKQNKCDRGICDIVTFLGELLVSLYDGHGEGPGAIIAEKSFKGQPCERNFVVKKD